MNTYSHLSFQNLHDPLRYEFQIDKLFNRIKDQKGIGALFDITQENIPVFSFGYDRRELARSLAISIRNEGYRFTPPVQRFVKTKNKNKKRILYQINILDKIVIGVLVKLLTEILLPFLNPCVFSYRKGVSAKDEVFSLAKYIKKQRATTQKHGVYLLQTDIASYSDEINIQETSFFWDKLAEYFDALNIKPSEYHWYLIKESIRPEYYNIDGALTTNLKGAPTGSPITTLIYNYYVGCVDFYLTSEPSLFYARYSDDIIICHTDASIVESAKDYLDIYLRALSLKLSEKKTRCFYFSPSGNSGIDPKWKGSNKVDLLGYSLNAQGDYTISTARQYKLLTKIRYRIKNTLAIIQNESLENQGRLLCYVVNSVLTDNSSTNHSLEALNYSSDSVQLKHLDFTIALLIAEAISGIRGPKAFRKVPYRHMRQNWGLLSLVVMRNKASTRAHELPEASLDLLSDVYADASPFPLESY